MLSGTLEVKWGDHLEQVVSIGPGDMVYVLPARPTSWRTCRDGRRPIAVVARDSPTEDSVEVPWAG